MTSDKIEMGLEELIKSSRQSGSVGAITQQCGRGGILRGHSHSGFSLNTDGQRGAALSLIGGVEQRRWTPYMPTQQVAEVGKRNLYKVDNRYRWNAAREVPVLEPLENGTGSLAITNLECGIKEFKRNDKDQGRGVLRGGVQHQRLISYVRPKKVAEVWKHDLFKIDNRSSADHTARAGAPVPSCSTLIIENLDLSVNDSDVAELFGEFGVLKSAAVRYDK